MSFPGPLGASRLVEIITSRDPAARNLSLDAAARQWPLKEMLEEAAALELFRRSSANLYEKARALAFLYALHRFHLPRQAALPLRGRIPFAGFEHLLSRRFEEAIGAFLSAQQADGPSDALSSALSAAYHGLAFQTLADQVRRSVRSVRGNQWMFRVGHPQDQPLRLRPELLRTSADGFYPILRESTPVRMDLSHSAWSDIFFLGMDFPEGARVLNVSIDLCVRGRDPRPAPPIEAHLRVIEEPLLRLVSVDLGAAADLTQLSDVFDFGKDYLGLLKAAVIASGIVPPGIEGSNHELSELLGRVVRPGCGIEIVSYVHDIPKGSRLAVSTNLLGCLISLCMRATGQAKSLAGPLLEEERRVAAARAILGEWLGGSGGGWQDSGGLWPGMKLIQGELAQPGDPEFGVSRGRLLPSHHILGLAEATAAAREALQESLVLVHGGMAQNVGPILEMVTEKYLLRSPAEWQARREAMAILEEILERLRQGDIRGIGQATTRNFFGPLQTIIPWASNAFTEELIAQVRAEFGGEFRGFWMLGGMAGGGMGFIFAPQAKERAQERLSARMSELKKELEHSAPFAMDPVVYDFAINEQGTISSVSHGASALMPAGYYALVVPDLLRGDARRLSRLKRAELDKFGEACRQRPELSGMIQALFDRLLPPLKPGSASEQSLETLLQECGFDPRQHEQIRADLKSGRIGLAQNRLPASAAIEDARPGDLVDALNGLDARCAERGRQALADGELAIVTLAAGAGSRWTQGAGTVKALHPFCKFSGKYRSFIEVHLAKGRRSSRLSGHPLPHIFTTGYLTHRPIETFLRRQNNYGYDGPLFLSPGRAVGLRLIPMIRDLRFAWEEMPQQILDEQKQKVRQSVHAALIEWAQRSGEGSDYTDNAPRQCLHPVGHWYEIPNLFRNGVLAELLERQPRLRYLLLHNIDTVGADADPALLGYHILSGATLSFELIARRLEDRGGGLARVDGRLRLVEGLALPREDLEFQLSYYNSMTTWIDLDALLETFGLNRADLRHELKVADAVRKLAQRMPTYVTLKEVKKRWGHGQEDIFPAAQFEKIWGDMSALPELNCRFLLAPRRRGQQLKDPAQLDGWVRDGSAEHVASLCEW